MVPRPTRYTLLPYTTLFRSSMPLQHGLQHVHQLPGRVGLLHNPIDIRIVEMRHGFHFVVAAAYHHRHVGADPPDRSEEHTSELQSHSDLVCRLLLEKRKERA